MIHIALHFIVPLAVGLLFYSGSWRNATIIMILTMIVDADHLLADPIYDPDRCSIGFHPLHTIPAIVIYIGLFATPLIQKMRTKTNALSSKARTVHLIGLGLIIHMALDWIDCFT